MATNTDYYSNYGGLSVEAYVERYITGSHSEMQRMRSTIGMLPEGVQSVLDVGAGHGIFLKELKTARGLSGTGIEITPQKIAYAKSLGVDLRMGDAIALPFEDRSFDALVSCEVLEHLPFGAYEKALNEMARVAKDWILISVPFEEKRSFNRCPYCGASSNSNQHFRSFFEKQMGGLFHGFQLEKIAREGRHKRSFIAELGKKYITYWPDFMICPSCGFHEPVSQQSSQGAGRTISISTLKKIAGWLPARSKAAWLIALYRRT